MICRELVAAAAVALALTAGCSDDNGPAKDAGPASDSTLWPCEDPGLSCNAHDPCAINPVCGEDHLCHPSFRQDCDDGLSCTKDSCGGPGQCINTPDPGSCALLVKQSGTSEMQCFSKGDPNPDDPCQQCDPDQDPNKWSDASGAICDDKNPCTKDDRCKDGACQGTYFSCSDELVCTEDICDGKGGCGHTLKTGYCLIGKACFKDQEKDAGECAICDVSKTHTAWTPLPGLCKIGESCYQPGDKDATGCGVCDPQQDGSVWSVATDACLINGVCYASGAPQPGGCATCEPTKSTTAWTPKSGSCLVGSVCASSGATSPSGCGVCDPAKTAQGWSPASGSTTPAQADFESGTGSFTLDPAVNGVGWQVSTKRAHQGSSSLYYGDPAKASYDNGAQNGGSAKLPTLALTAGKKSALWFWLYLDTETTDGFDVLSVKVGTQTVWQKSSTTVLRYGEWFPVEVDLSSFAGQSVALSFAFDTKDAWSNSGEGVYVDDVKLLTGCP